MKLQERHWIFRQQFYQIQIINYLKNKIEQFDKKMSLEIVVIIKKRKLNGY